MIVIKRSTSGVFLYNDNPIKVDFKIYFMDDHGICVSQTETEWNSSNESFSGKSEEETIMITAIPPDILINMLEEMIKSARYIYGDAKYEEWSREGWLTIENGESS